MIASSAVQGGHISFAYPDKEHSLQVASAPMTATASDKAWLSLCWAICWSSWKYTVGAPPVNREYFFFWSRSASIQKTLLYTLLPCMETLSAMDLKSQQACAGENQVLVRTPIIAPAAPQSGGGTPKSDNTPQMHFSVAAPSSSSFGGRFRRNLARAPRARLVRATVFPGG